MNELEVVFLIGFFLVAFQAFIQALAFVIALIQTVIGFII